MVADGEGIDRRVARLDVITQQVGKAIPVHAGPVGSAAEAAQAASGKGEVMQVHHGGGIGTAHLEALDHAREGATILRKVAHDGDATRIVLGRRLAGHGGLYQRLVCHGLHTLVRKTLLDRPEHMREEGPGLLLPALGEEVLHVSREPLDVAKAQVGAVLADELMGGGVVEVL